MSAIIHSEDKESSQRFFNSPAACHILDKGGVSDPSHRTSEDINGQFGGVNAPTVYNAYFNIQQFWNGRAADLAAQAAGPPANPVEMGDQTWEQICARLSQDAALVAEFEQLYPGQGLTEATVTLRNVALTAPYFHDGSIATLEEAIRAMCRYELGKPITEEEVREMVEFL